MMLSSSAVDRVWGDRPATTARLIAAGAALYFYPVLDQRRPLQLTHADVLKVAGLREPVEEALAAAEDHRRDNDRELIDDTGIKALADHVRAAADGDVPVTRDLASVLDRLVEPADEVELTGVRLLLRAVRDDEDRDVPRVLVAPVPGRLVHPAADDNRTGPGHRRIQELERLARGLAFRLVVVAPGPVEHPVVQPLAALSKALAGSVVPARDVAINRRRDRRDHLRHGALSCRRSAVETNHGVRNHRRPARSYPCATMATPSRCPQEPGIRGAERSSGVA